MPPTTNANFPSFEAIMNQVRAICNDSFAGYTDTAGEGQIISDHLSDGTTNNPLVLNHLNSSIRELYRKIRITGDALLIQDNYIVTGLAVVNSSLGVGVTNPAIQTWLDTTGYWDGMEYNTPPPTQLLPTDMYLPIRLWERTNGTTDTFFPMTQVFNGLPPRDQVGRLSQWEYRNGALYFVGATTVRDIRIRYASLFPTYFTADLDFTNTFIPVLDCQEFVAYKTAEKIALSLGNAQVATALETLTNGHLYDIKNERVRRMQQIRFRRPGYNDSDGLGLDQFGI